MRVLEVAGGYEIGGDWEGRDSANAFLRHLAERGFSLATVRAYGFDVANLARFLTERDAKLSAVQATHAACQPSFTRIVRSGTAGSAPCGRLLERCELGH
ncbi:MAG: site-specific integrase [Mycobacterium sp.]